MVRCLWLICAVAMLFIPTSVAAHDIVIVPSSDAEPYRLAKSRLQIKLTDLGHSAQTIALDALDDDRLSDLEQAGHIFVAVGSSAAVSLNGRLSDASHLIYCMVTDPVAHRLTQRDLTYGLSTQVPVSQQLDLISEAMPDARVIGVLYSSESEDSRETLEEVRRVLPIGWQLKATDIDEYKTTADALQALFKSRPHIVWTSADSTVFNSATIRSLLLTALRKKTPIFGFSTPFVRAGALLGIGIDPGTQGEDAALLTDEVARKGPLVEKEFRHRVPRFDVAVNLLVAEELDIELPKSTVARARHQFSRQNEPNP